MHDSTIALIDAMTWLCSALELLKPTQFARASAADKMHRIVDEAPDDLDEQIERVVLEELKHFAELRYGEPYKFVGEGTTRERIVSLYYELLGEVEKIRDIHTTNVRQLV